MATAFERDLQHTLEQFADLPPWLETAVNPERVAELLRARVPELASGEMTLHVEAFKRLHLKKTPGCWNGIYTYSLEGVGREPRTLLLEGSVYAPTAALPDNIDAPTTAPFGEEGWRCWLPEQRLLVQVALPEQVPPPREELADPEQVRPILEHALRAGADGYEDVQIEACAVKVLDHKPGVTTIFRYDLTYPPALVDRNWRDVVFAKYYGEGQDEKSANAYAGIRNLWRSPLHRGDVVSIAEALGYIPELRTVLQGAVQEECNLEDFLREAVQTNEPQAWETLNDHTRKTAVALAALHKSGVDHPERLDWDDLHGDVLKHFKRLKPLFPEMMEGIATIIKRIDELAATAPADPDVPSHGGFRPEQVLIYKGQIGFIDFDMFGMAEPAQDISRFRSMMKKYGANLRRHGYAGREAMLQRIAQLDEVNEIFLQAYEAQAPVSRQRVVLWEALYHLNDLLNTWAKARVENRSAAIYMLESHLRMIGL